MIFLKTYRPRIYSIYFNASNALIATVSLSVQASVFTSCNLSSDGSAFTNSQTTAYVASYNVC
jgi:hypothetical protein